MTNRFDPAAPDDALQTFLTERHLATLTTLRADGTPHVVAVGFTYDPPRRLARVITFAGSVKARNVAARPGAPAALCQLDGARWVTLEGVARLADDPEAIEEAVRRYAERYRAPRPRADRVAIELTVTKIMGQVRPRV